MSNAFFASAAETAMRQPGTSSRGSESILRELFSRVVYAVSTVLEYYNFKDISKRLHSYIPLALGLFFTSTTYLFFSPVLLGQSPSLPASSSSFGNLASAQVERAKEDVERI